MFLLLCCIVSAQAQKDKAKHYNVEKNVALQGYDPVSYFTNEGVKKGNPTIQTTYGEVTYYFANENNKSRFLKSPEDFEPQYGGWCAFAMGDYAKKVEVDPKTFKIIDGKLYLFYNAYLNNTLKSWNKNEEKLKAQADVNWAQLTKQ